MKTKNILLNVLRITAVFLASLAWSSAITVSSLAETTGGGDFFYVKPDATGDCFSWAKACDLQKALGIAISGSQVWVAEGVYHPGASGNRAASFKLVSGVKIYGGFKGTETALHQRDWVGNITALSGDIDENDNTDPYGVVTDTDKIVGSNSYQVVRGDGVSDAAVLDGFTITGGKADGVELEGTPEFAGGMYNNNSSPTLTNLTFSGNWAIQEGGGMVNQNSSPSMTNVTFIANKAGSGGGMANFAGSSPILMDVTFSGNSAEYEGGGMLNWGSSNPTLTDVTFSGNKAPNGGGMSNVRSAPTLISVDFSKNNATYGGGLYNDLCSPRLYRVTFRDNQATLFGGGMYNQKSSPELTRVIFRGNQTIDFFEGAAGGGMYNISSSNPRLRNVIFFDNYAASQGGGMYNEGSSPTLINVTFNANDSNSIGGIVNISSSNPKLSNVIMWGNTAWAGNSQIKNTESTPVIAYSLIQGCSGSGAGWDTSLGTDGGGNIDADPLFVDAANGNLDLQPNSPAIDAGDNTTVPIEVLTDLYGSTRYVDVPDIPDTGSGSAPIVDMGAYEFQNAWLYLPMVWQ